MNVSSWFAIRRRGHYLIIAYFYSYLLLATVRSKFHGVTVMCPPTQLHCRLADSFSEPEYSSCMELCNRQIFSAMMNMKSFYSRLKRSTQKYNETN